MLNSNYFMGFVNFSTNQIRKPFDKKNTSKVPNKCRKISTKSIGLCLLILTGCIFVLKKAIEKKKSKSKDGSGESKINLDQEFLGDFR